MIDARTAPYAAFLLRVTLGLAFLAHGFYLKVFVFTMAGTAGFFESIGLPGVLAWAVMAIETVAGVMLILGIRTRIAVLATLPILLGATWAHSGAGWLFTNQGGGWEYPAFWSAILVVQGLLGDGAFALAPEAESRERAVPVAA